MRNPLRIEVPLPSLCRTLFCAPHIHAVVVPITADNRLSSRDVFSLMSLRQLHHLTTESNQQITQLAAIASANALEYAWVRVLDWQVRQEVACSYYTPFSTRFTAQIQ